MKKKTIRRAHTRRITGRNGVKKLIHVRAHTVTFESHWSSHPIRKKLGSPVNRKTKRKAYINTNETETYTARNAKGQFMGRVSRKNMNR